MTSLTRDDAREWINRWDRQQEVCLPTREERFTALIDAVETGAGRPDPLVLDLGCGPGSLSARLAARLPQVTIIAIDIDPVLLALANEVYGDLPGLRFTDVDLRTPGWAAALDLDRLVDAAVSTTALHWLRPPALRALYAELTTVMRPGGLFLDGDHFTVEEPALAGIDRALLEREERRRHPDGHPEGWEQWWEAVAADPALAGLNAARESRRTDADHHGSESTRLTTHTSALRDAGFTQIGTVWQHGESRILCATAPQR